jgi:hypothetical protein
MTKKMKRRSVALGMFLVLAIAAGGAYAYWTNAGSGSGAATTAAGATGSVTVAQTTAITGLTPGGTAKALVGTITNSTDSNIRVGTLTASFTGTTFQAGCTAADYQINGSPLTVNSTINAGANMAIPAGITVQMKETGANQDACKGQALVLSFATT